MTNDLRPQGSRPDADWPRPQTALPLVVKPTETAATAAPPSIKWFPDSFDFTAALRFRRPFHTFIVKVASMCNLNCSYCYVYQTPDDSWRWKPKRLEIEVARQIALRIQEHADEHDLSDVSVILHGGEPLLLGREHLFHLARIFESSINCRIHWGLQTNATLLDEETVSWLYEHRFSVGISLDGTREHNDRHRLFHGGRSSYIDTIRGIELVKAHSEWQQVLNGILVVVDLQHSPAEILRAVDSLGLRGAKLLLPDAHYESPPPTQGDTTYGEWLCQFFDVWCRDFAHIEVPFLEEIIALMLGCESEAEEIGAQSVDLIVVETNGDLEAVDTLKIVGREATSTGLNVFKNSFTEALSHPAIVARMSGFDSLCQTCRDCRYLRNCGGGYIPHRFSLKSGFQNPSVYCPDLQRLFTRINQALVDIPRFRDP